ncbi:MAG: PAS domain S-box protein, partial [Candidatus Omnitrophica bacterium]|nr:PAS domain S-box protein [Candidatus Omnitrophota bacterium]
MNSILLLSLFSFFIYSYLAVFVFVKNPKELINRVCSGSILCFVVWSFGMIFYMNFNLPAETRCLFMNIGSLGWITFSSLFVLFILVFSENWTLLNKKITYVALFGGIPVFIYMQWTGQLLVAVEKHGSWMIDAWSGSVWPHIFAAYYLALMLWGVFVLMRCGIASGDARKRRYVRILFTSVCVSLMLVTITDIIIPMAHFYHVPSVGGILTLFWALGLYYAIEKYKFLAVTPARAAENIISTMTDALILLNTGGEMVAVNNAACDMLKYKKEELRGVKMDLLVTEKNFTEKIKSRILEEKKINNEEMYLVAKNKVQIPVSFSASLLASGTGDFSGIVCVIRDITEQKITENILLEDEQKLRKKTTKLETALSESEKIRRIMLTMLEDNNII